MSLKRTHWHRGKLVCLEHSSRFLQGNPQQDPTDRVLQVWLPPQYDQQPKRRFPVLFDLVGYTGSGPSHTNWRSFDENVPERAARLIHERRMAPAILVFPDCFTALGGNQYINTSALGRYADYLTRELVPLVDREFRTLAGRDHRGCFGKSSGGYGAIIHGMKYAGTWGAVANHSGDAYFDFVYRTDWPSTLNRLADFRKPPRKPGKVDIARLEAGLTPGSDDGRVKAFLDYLHQNDKPSGTDIHTLMNLCMAASYDPDPRAPNGFRLPFNLETGELLQNRWKKWLAHDPINLVEKYAKNLKSLRGIWMDCGWRDQYHIHYGMRILSKRMKRKGIQHTYEEFDDTHSGIDYRMDRSLPFLTRVLKTR